MNRTHLVALATISFGATVMGYVKPVSLLQGDIALAVCTAFSINSSVCNGNFETSSGSAIAANPIPTQGDGKEVAPDSKSSMEKLTELTDYCNSGTITKTVRGIDTDGRIYNVYYDFSRGSEKINPTACGREYWIAVEGSDRNYGIVFVYLVDGQKNRVYPGRYVETINGDITTWNGNTTNPQLRRTQPQLSKMPGTRVSVQGQGSQQAVPTPRTTEGGSPNSNPSSTQGNRQNSSENSKPSSRQGNRQSGSQSSKPSSTQGNNGNPPKRNGNTPPTTLLSKVVGTGVAASCTEAAFITALTGGGSITFKCGSSPITIRVTEKLISANTIIDGGNLVTLSGGGTNRIFKTADNYIELTVKNLTIANGYTTEDGGGIFLGYRGKLTVINCKFNNNKSTKNTADSGGGAIFSKSESTLTVDNSTFTGNQAANAGAIYNLLSNLTVTNSTFTGNKAVNSTPAGSGGAIAIDGANPTGNTGKIQITNSKFVDNTGIFQGGAISVQLYNSDAMTIDQSTFSGNSITGTGSQGFGGAIFHTSDQKNYSRLTITNSTFSSNTASNQGGGIWTGNGAIVNITNSTISGNKAESSSGLSGTGGGIMRTSGRINLTNTTIANNYAGFQGGGIIGNTSVTLKNTIIANNKAYNGGKGWNIKNNCGDQMTNGGNNLQYPARNLNDTSDKDCVSGIKTADPKLGSLANNGGSTQTMALLSGSAALNAGNNSTCPTTDQRAVTRPQYVTCDIGAFEFK
ncbi:hypothetical protein H6F77_23280 [Microcoleus sp. FACHB-831]|uniref:choice-of-anchor Q domain-containing protein n=1 Tax=Microcoleus sp. FACHB-831 TaxID=2692827 RepID=UPI001687A361|nr:choice-of-anchor Q domain-containing protein [Microcoleus sp. FACHB-831]MBD1923968.1 hypothetical protein [Microcoleus sp. FACHB-831]